MKGTKLCPLQLEIRSGKPRQGKKSKSDQAPVPTGWQLTLPASAERDSGDPRRSEFTYFLYYVTAAISLKSWGFLGETPAFSGFPHCTSKSPKA